MILGWQFNYFIERFVFGAYKNCYYYYCYGYNAEWCVLCFGSLGSVHKDVWTDLKKLCRDKDAFKDVVRDCSISAIIGANYIWRHRVKKLDTVKPVKHQWVLPPPCMHGIDNDHVCTVGYRGTLFSQCTSDHCLSILNHVHIHSGNQNPVFLCSIFHLLF